MSTIHARGRPAARTSTPVRAWPATNRRLVRTMVATPALVQAALLGGAAMVLITDPAWSAPNPRTTTVERTNVVRATGTVRTNDAVWSRTTPARTSNTVRITPVPAGTAARTSTPVWSRTTLANPVALAVTSADHLITSARTNTRTTEAHRTTTGWSGTNPARTTRSNPVPRTTTVRLTGPDRTTEAARTNPARTTRTDSAPRTSGPRTVAADSVAGSTSAVLADEVAADSLDTVINNIRTWLIGLLAAIATLFLTVGGVRLMWANGDPGEAEKGKTALKSAAIGYGLALLAPLIVTIVGKWVA